MLVELLWPDRFRVRVGHVELVDNSISVVVDGLQTMECCPDCGAESSRINSRYRRRPYDLPCAGYAVRLELNVPRFFCDQTSCPRKTFAAQFPEMLQPYAHRTKRLKTHHEVVAFASSSETGAGLTESLGMSISADTLIRTIRATPEPEVENLKVVGIDDWAKRKGRTYGTIIVDLESHQVVDVLDDRSADSVAEWLQQHPTIEVISRDRGAEYIAGATEGAPDAIQVADRFHLLQNLLGVVKRFFDKEAPLLRQAAHAVAEEESSVTEVPADLTEQIDMNVAEEVIVSAPTMRQLRFDEVKALQADGWSKQAVATHLNMSRKTVAKYYALNMLPSRAIRPQTSSSAAAYLPYLKERWQAGCHNMAELHIEIQAQGFEGHYSSVYRAVKNMLRQGTIATPTKSNSYSVPSLSARQAAWLLIDDDNDNLEPEQLKLRDKLLELSDSVRQVRSLAQSFRQLVREKQAEDLDSWLEKAVKSGLRCFKAFAEGLKRDYDAVKAALTYQWSQGQVEGQVHRLKNLKRLMYGRANDDLLRKRVLGPAASSDS